MYGLIIALFLLLISVLYECARIGFAATLGGDAAYKTGSQEKNERNIDCREMQQVIDALTQSMSKNLKEEFAKRFTEIATKKNLDPIITLDDIKHSLTYEPGTKPYRTSVHIGQRKLHDSEVQFFTDNINPKQQVVCVYAGAAPSNHTGFLADLFPNIKFILVDPNNFEIRGAHPVTLHKRGASDISREQAVGLIKQATGDARIYIIQDYFTMELSGAIREVIDVPVYFISDIRTNIANGKSQPDAIDILWNLSQQYNWINEMKPTMSMLKFRHPFYEEDPGVFEKNSELPPYKYDFELSKKNGIDFRANFKEKRLMYFDGVINIQAYPPVSSTETRLITDGKTIRDWGTPNTYENKLYYYNTIARWAGHFKNPNANPKLGFDNCNDCAIENHIWTKYLKVYGPVVGGNHTVHELVKKLSDITYRPLMRDNHGRHFGLLNMPRVLNDINRHVNRPKYPNKKN